ncbi:MAG: hypothetical protein ABW076_16805 [Candidatus Thiodiazotropha sp.]
MMFKDIYLIDVEGLAKRLSEAAVNDVVALKNFIVFIVLFSSTYELPISINISSSEEGMGFLTTVLIWSVMAAANYWGLRLIFHTNSKGDGIDFFKRYCALSLPVSVVTVLYFLVVMLGVGVTALILSQSSDLDLNKIIIP